MRVFQIKAKFNSPKNNTNSNITKLSITKNKIISNNISQRTRNLNYSKDRNIFKKIFPYTSKHQYHYSSNDCSLINTTNFNNSKTNNFIFFENTMNYRDNEILKQIKSLIKHNSSNNVSNIKFINNNNYANRNRKNKKLNCKKEEFDSKKNLSDKISLNKTSKLSISTNYSLLLKNKENKEEKIRKVKCIKLNILNPLTANFNNEINGLNSFRKIVTNKSTKYFNTYKLNNDLKKKHLEKRAKSTDKKKVKSNSTNKRINQKKLINNKKILRNQRSYNEILYSYIKSLSKSSSFSPKRTKEEKNINNKINNKNKPFVKASSVNNKINLQFFKSKNADNINTNNFTRKKSSHLSPKRIDMKLYTKKLSNKKIEKIEMNNNNTFMKVKRRSIKCKNVKIVTPEENHFLAVINIQKIKSNGININ